MSHKTNRRVSSRDVARLAGVSQATVSRVFTPGKQVSEEKRKRVLEAAHELNYKPSVIARSLIQNSTKIIGIVIRKFENLFYVRALDLFSRKLQSLGYSVMLFDIAGDQAVEDTLPIALQYQVDGVIITSATLSSPLVEDCSRLDTPVVLFNRVNEGENVHSVCTDNLNAGREIAGYLISKGHRKLSFIAGERSSSTNRNREQGFINRLQEEGLRLFSSYEGDFEYPSGLEAARQLLSQQEKPTAVFCSSDNMAMAFIDAATTEFGLSVPQDISVVGFDDISMASWPRYNLTTYHQYTEKLVDNTITVLLEALKDPEMPIAHQFLQGRLIQRGTVKELS